MISDKDVRHLATLKRDPALSIYIPTNRAGDPEKDKIQLKNATQKAERQLKAYGVDIPNREKLLKPIYKLQDDKEFWMHLSDGLVIFRSDSEMECYTIPVEVESLTYVGKQYYLYPVLPVVGGEVRFFLLALSQNEVRFFEGHRYSITPVEIDDLVPEDPEEVLADLADNGHLQYHTSSGERTGTPIFHGQGSNKDRRPVNVEKYLRAVDDGLMKMLYDESPPMILAAVDYLVPIYREITQYKSVLKQHISGNPEGKDPVLLHEQAWDILKSYFEMDEKAKRETFEEQFTAGKASFATDHIVTAAGDKRIDTLFLVKGTHEWGGYDTDTRKVTHCADYSVECIDLIEYAAIQTYLNGGTVYLVDRSELPQPAANMNAIYRF